MRNCNFKRIRKLLTLLAAVLICPILLPTMSFADWPGWLSGKVTDASTGAAIIGATITSSAGGSGTSVSPDGSFFFQVPSTSMNVTASKTNYNNMTATNVVVSPNVEVQLNFALTSTVQPTQVTLAITKSGAGNGTVTGAGTYNQGVNAPASAAADSSSTFAGWGGDCAAFGTSAQINVAMTDNKNCTATFSLATVMINVTRYTALQSAFDSVASNNLVIKIMTGTYSVGGLVFNKPYAVTLKGGFDSGFVSNSGSFTTIAGTLTIQQGTVVIENMVIR